MTLGKTIWLLGLNLKMDKIRAPFSTQYLKKLTDLLKLLKLYQKGNKNDHIHQY
jgi:hypothetical protein